MLFVVWCVVARCLLAVRVFVHCFVAFDCGLAGVVRCLIVVVLLLLVYRLLCVTCYCFLLLLLIFFCCCSLFAFDACRCLLLPCFVVGGCCSLCAVCCVLLVDCGRVLLFVARC